MEKGRTNVSDKVSGAPEVSGVIQTAPESEEWIFTLTNKTGELLKVEKIDRASGERKELSEEEYSSVYGATSEYGYDPYGEALANYSYDAYAAYYQGIADYEAALTQASVEYAPEEEAYYQGIADYEAALSGTSSEYEFSPNEQAYYQGIADYQSSL